MKRHLRPQVNTSHQCTVAARPLKNWNQNETIVYCLRVTRIDFFIAFSLKNDYSQLGWQSTAFFRVILNSVTKEGCRWSRVLKNACRLQTSLRVREGAHRLASIYIKSTYNFVPTFDIWNTRKTLCVSAWGGVFEPRFFQGSSNFFS